MRAASSVDSKGLLRHDERRALQCLSLHFFPSRNSISTLAVSGVNSSSRIGCTRIRPSIQLNVYGGASVKLTVDSRKAQPSFRRFAIWVPVSLNPVEFWYWIVSVRRLICVNLAPEVPPRHSPSMILEKAEDKELLTLGANTSYWW